MVDFLSIVRDNSLTPDGFGVGETPDPAWASSSEIAEQVQRCRNWTRQFYRRQTVNRMASSRDFVGMAEAETGATVCQGAFLIACYLEDIMVRRVGATDDDGWINLSLKRIPPGER
jgi:hypothetical protein